jgi:hypothetical protein
MHTTSSAAMLMLALTCAAQPALAQDARACANEVQRLSEGLPLLHAQGQEGEALAQEPGARKGASLPDERRQHIADLVRQAAAAGEQGDGPGCLRGLGEARALLREAGLGSGQPGPATYDSPAGAGSAAGGANLGGVGSASTPARSPSSGSVGSIDTQSTGNAGAVSDAVGSGPTSPTRRGGAGDTTTGGSTSGGMGGAGGGATGGSSGGGSR